MNKKIAYLILLIFFTSSAMAMSGSYQSLYLNQVVGLSNSLIGNYYTLSSVFNVLISLGLAYLSDRYTRLRKYIIYIGLICAIGGYILYSRCHSFITITTVSCSLIAISSCITPQLFALSNEVFSSQGLSREQVSSKITMLRTVISFSYVVGPIIGTLILQENQFIRLYLCMSLIYLISLLILLVFFNRYEIKDEYKRKGNQNKINYYYLIYLFILFVFIQIIHSTISNIFPVYLTNVKGYSNHIIGVISSYSAFLEIPLMIIWTYLIQRYSLKKLLIIGMLSGLLFIMIYPSINNVYICVISYILNAIFYSSTIGLGLPFFQNLIPSSSGMSTTLFLNTSSVAKIISGSVLAIIGTNYYFLFLVMGMILIVSILSVFFVKIE